MSTLNEVSPTPTQHPLIPVYKLAPKATATKAKEGSPLRVTISGRVVDLLEPKSSQIALYDIAEGLSKICRYTGHTSVFYSVAQHCCIVHDIVPPEAKPYALLHDAHEAYIGDLPTPLLAALGSLGASHAVETIKDRLDRAILAAIGLPYPSAEIINAVKKADAQALAWERRDILPTIMGQHPLWANQPEITISRQLKGWNWDTAMNGWLNRFESLALEKKIGEVM